jgi:hypothetical protein
MIRSLAALVAAALLLPIALAEAKIPKVKPKTGTYTGKAVNENGPGTLRVVKRHGKLRVASLTLEFHVTCSAEDGTQTEKTVPITVSGKMRKAQVSTNGPQPANSYRFQAEKSAGGGVNEPSTFYNIVAEWPAAKRAHVDGIYNEEINNEEGSTVSSCDASDTWNLKHR